MPGVSVFIDANVLLYAREENSLDRALIAATWVRLLSAVNRGRTNLQVLNEVTNVLLRKRQDIPALQVFRETDALRPFGASPVHDGHVSLARSIRISSRYSWWDCLLLASALELGCTHFLSEDLQNGQTISDGIRSLTIIDPFAHSPEQFLAQ